MTDPFEAAAEGGKAVQEVAKTTARAIESGEKIGVWFEGKIGEPLEAAIGWALTDNLLAARAARQIKHRERLILLARRSQSRLEALGVTQIVDVPEKVAEPLLRAAVLEEEPELQELWARLLATTLTEEAELYRVFVGILEQVTATDARVLSEYYGRTPAAVEKDRFTPSGVRHSTYSLSGTNFDPTNVRNLYRLGLIEPSIVTFEVLQDFQGGGYGSSAKGEPRDIELPGDLGRVQVTELGEAFCKAVGMTAGDL